jgi:hypothetical protein
MKINKLLESKKLNEDVASKLTVNGKKLIQYLEQNKFTKSGDGKKNLSYTKSVGNNTMTVSFTELEIRVKVGDKEVPFKHVDAYKAHKLIHKNLKILASGKFDKRAEGDNKIVTTPKSAKEVEEAPLRHTYKSKAGTFRKVNTSTWEFISADGKQKKQVRTPDVINHFFPTDSKAVKDKDGKEKTDDLGNTQYQKGTGIIGQRFKDGKHLTKLLKNKYDVQTTSLKDKNTFLAYDSKGKQIKVGVEPTKENKKGEVIEYQIKSIKESLQNDRRPGMKINKLLESTENDFIWDSWGDGKYRVVYKNAECDVYSDFRQKGRYVLDRVDGKRVGTGK